MIQRMITVGVCCFLMLWPSYGAKLHVCGLAGYLPVTVLKEFERKTGICVVYDAVESTETLMVKLYARYGQYDLVIMNMYPHVIQGFSSGLFFLLKHKNIPHWRNIDPVIARRILKNGEAVAAPYLWGTTGIIGKSGLNTGAVDWSWVFSANRLKRYKKKAVWMDSALDVFCAAAVFLDIYDSVWTKDIVLRISQYLQTVRKFVNIVPPDRLVEQLVKDEVDVALLWSHDAGLVIQRADKEKYMYDLPSKGAFCWMDVLTIPQRARHKKQAHMLINFLLHSQTIDKTLQVLPGYGCVKPIQFHPSMPLPKVGQKFFIEPLMTPKIERLMLREWLSIKSCIPT